MAIDVFDLYLRVQADVNTWQLGHLKPDFFNMYMYEESRALHREKFENWELNQRTTDDYAKPFLKTVNLAIAAQPGQAYDLAGYPGDYKYFSSARMIFNKEKKCGCACKEFPICDAEGNIIDKNRIANGQTKFQDPDLIELAKIEADKNIKEVIVNKIDNMRWGALTTHPLRAPKLDKPAITQYNSGFKVMPKGLQFIVMDYFIQPIVPKFAYTLGAGDTVTYNIGASVQLEWDPSMINELVARIARRFAKFIGDEKLYAISDKERLEAK